MPAGPAPSVTLPSDGSLLNSLLSQEGDAVLFTNADFTITQFSAAAERLCGRTRDDVIGRNWLATIPTEIASDNAASIGEQLQAGRDVHADVRIHRPDGSCVDVQLSASPLRDSDGRLTGWLAIGRDQTQAKEAERRERELRTRLEAVLDGSRQAFVDVDLVRGIVYRSPALARMLGVDADAIAPDLSGLQPFADRHDWQRHAAAASAVVTGAAGHVEFEGRLRHRDGHWIWVQGRYAAVDWDAAGKPIRIAGTITDITAEKTAREQLRLSEARLARVVEGAGVVYFDHDLVTGHAYRSPEMARLLGCAPSDIPATIDALEPRLHPDDVARRRQERAAILSGEQRGSHTHYRLRHNDGHWIWVAALSSVVARDDQGRPTRVAGLVADITPQKALESSLREREARLRAFFDSPGVGVIVARADGTMVEVNDRACEILGYRREELVALTWPEVTFPDDLTADADLYARMAAGEIEHYAMDKRYRRRDGQVVWCLLSVSCVRAADGGIDLAVGIIKDITRRKEAERKLRESESMFRTVVEEASDAIDLFDLQTGRITLMNTRYADQAGFSQDELRTMTADEARERIHPDDRERVSAHLAQLLAAGRSAPAPLEYRWQTKAGEYRWLSHTRTVVRGDAGEPVALVGVRQDITERKRAEEAIRAALADNANLISELRDRLASNRLAAIMPICMYCKKIRDEEQQWLTVEHYISRHTGSAFSHGMCPECAQRIFEEAGDKGLE